MATKLKLDEIKSLSGMDFQHMTKLKEDILALRDIIDSNKDELMEEIAKVSIKLDSLGISSTEALNSLKVSVDANNTESVKRVKTVEDKVESMTSAIKLRSDSADDKTDGRIKELEDNLGMVIDRLSVVSNASELNVKNILSNVRGVEGKIDAVKVSLSELIYKNENTFWKRVKKFFTGKK